MKTSIKETIWKSFSFHFDELKKLQVQLQEIDVHREDVQQKIETKKRVIERATGLSWEDISASAINVSRNNAVQQIVQRDTKSGAKRETKRKGTVRQWVLRAIAHFEANNPQSHIDESSIRIYIDSEAPGFLANHSAHAVGATLKFLYNKGLVVRNRTSKNNRYQYSLTEAARKELD